MSDLTHTDLNFWQNSWKKRYIGFHMDERHPMLVKHLDRIVNGREKCKILFPLCGKAVDMLWFASMGHEVVGVEGVKTAVEEFFNENQLEYTIREVTDFQVYESKDKMIKLYLGNFFKFSNSNEGAFNAVWDRGSLVAVAPDERNLYAETMIPLLAPDCIYLLSTFDYDTLEYPGPPHYISEQLINELYSKKLDIQLIDRQCDERLASIVGVKLMECIRLLQLKKS